MEEAEVLTSGSEVIPRDFLRCPLCRDEYQEPKFLPCLHSFCKACIDDHIESSTAPDGHFVCPVCLTEINPPPSDDAETDDASAPASSHTHHVAGSGGVPELPDNVFARRLSCPAVSHDKKAEVRYCQQQQCSSNNSNGGSSGAQTQTEARIHCINCDEFMCAQCSMEHLAEKETSSHKTQSIEDYIREHDDDDDSPTHGGSAAEFVPLPQCCQFYDALDIGTMYCVDCEMATCNECHAKDHADHRCAELSAVAQNFETKIREPLLQLKKDENRLKKELTYLDNARIYLARKQQKLKALAKERSKMLWSLIQEYENMLNMEIDKRHAQNMSIIQDQHDVLNRHVASIYAVTDLSDKLLTFGSMEEKVSMRRQIGRRVRELCEGEVPTGRVELNRFVISEPRVGVESICEMFGELIVDRTVTTGTTRRRSSVSYEGSSNNSSNGNSGNDTNNKSHRKQGSSRGALSSSHSIDLGTLGMGRDSANATGSSSSSRRRSAISMSSTEEPATELADLDEYEEEEEGDDSSDLLSASNTSDVLSVEIRRFSSSSNGHYNDYKIGQTSSSVEVRGRQTVSDSGSTIVNSYSNHLEVPSSSYSSHKRRVQLPSNSSTHNDSVASASDTSYQSSIFQNDVPCQNLEEPAREMRFPDIIAKDCIKGIGVTPGEGDIVVATVSPTEGNRVYILEKRGIVRGQLDLDRNFNIHSVAPDGKVFTVVARSENRYKVKVLTADNRTLVDVHIESFGLSGLAAMSSGTLLITSSRYASTNPNVGRAAKLGGNVTLYDRHGAVQQVITNDTFSSSLDMQLFDRPHCVAVDDNDNFFVADPGRHSVVGFKPDGSFLFEYGTTDAEEELYQGPDAVCTDHCGNVIVLDKKDGRIDILSYEGQLLRCYFPSYHIRYVSVTPDKLLALVDSEGDVKFYDYFTCIPV